MKLENYQIRNQIRARFLRYYRRGLIKKKTKAENAFEKILNKLRVSFIPQAGFLSARTFYIVDYYIKYPYKLIVEIDGEDHRGRKKVIRDKEKISYLRRSGFRVIRFSNENVLKEKQKIKRQLCRCLDSIKKHGNS